MLFLIDYENVNCSGLKGVELLTPKDNLSIFYGQSSSKIERDVFQKIIATNCVLNIQKLDAPGKNALDFMIIAHIHTLFNNGGNEPIIIISKDKGYNVVRQYWDARGKRVFIRPNIYTGIIAANEQNERYRIAHARVERVDIEQEYHQYLRRKNERNRLIEIIGRDTDEIESLITFLAQAPSPKEKYLHLLKTYGRALGLQLYREVKLFGTGAAS